MCVFCHSASKTQPGGQTVADYYGLSPAAWGFPGDHVTAVVFFLPSLLGVVFIMGCQSGLLMTIMGWRRGRSVSIATWLLRGQGLRKGKAVCTCWYCVRGGDDYYGL